MLSRALLAPLLLCFGFASDSTESASANGETRTISFSNGHTNESGSFTYMVDGVYDSAVLEKLNWFLRDWRHDEKIHMDPRLFDIVWEVYRESGSSQPIDVLSAYRSPETNAMLRRRSRQVAEHSQHMVGKAMDAHFVDVPTSRIRDIAMRMEAGGVGFYPTGNTPWVHIDSGSVRYWPRMSRDQIARLFPDGKTVFIPSDGVPMAGYQQALAEVEARGGAVYAGSAQGGGKSLFAMLFGGGEDEQEENGASGQAIVAAAPIANGRGGLSSRPIVTAQNFAGVGTPDPIAKAKRDLPHGETFLRAPEPSTPIAPSRQTQIAALEQPHGDGTAVAAQSAPADQWVAPLPPARPTELMFALTSIADVPVPPARPVEFAALDTDTSAAIAARKNDLIAALLARSLPSVITRGAGAPLPKNALGLAEVDSGAAGRPALAKAAALAAPLPPTDQARLTALARAALLTWPAPPPVRRASKSPLVAARIDRSNFTVMTAPATAAGAAVGDGAPRIVPVSPTPRPNAELAMMAPVAEAPIPFAAEPYGDLRSDAFTGPAVKALEEAAGAAPLELRGQSD